MRDVMSARGVGSVVLGSRYEFILDLDSKLRLNVDISRDVSWFKVVVGG